LQDLFKQLIPSLTEGKVPILEEEKEYNPFIVNKALSRYLDMILYANEMNINPNLDKRMQYDYLFHSIRKRKRAFIPWDKKDDNPTLKTIMDYFNCSIQKAKDTINILTKEQINEIMEIMSTKEYKQ
jgi:hypothetical protein